MPDASRVVTVADGVKALEVQRISPLPPTLDALLDGLAARRSRDVRVRGRRAACEDQHDYLPWITGVYCSLELRLSRCQFCGAVEVRDVSLDMLSGLAVGRGGPRRRSDVLGWYSGARTNGRQHI